MNIKQVYKEYTSYKQVFKECYYYAESDDKPLGLRRKQR